MRRDYVTTFITEGFVIACYLLAFRLVASSMGTAGFGEYSLSRRTLSLLLPLGVLGLDVGIARYVSYAAAEKSSRFAAYAPGGLVIMFAGVGIVSAVLLLFSRFWAHLFFGSPAYNDLVLAMPVVLLGGALHVVAYGYLRGLTKIQWANLLMAVNQGLMPLIAIKFFGHSVAEIMSAIGVGWIVVSLIPLVRLPMSFTQVPGRIRELARFGVPRVPGDFIQLTLFAMPSLLVAHTADIRVAGIVAFGVAALSMVGSGLTPISFVLLPAASRMFAAGSVARLRTQIMQVGGLTFAGTVFAVAFFELFATPIVSIYLGPSFAGGVTWLRLTLIGAVPWGIYITHRSVIDAGHVFPMNARNMLISFVGFVVALLVLNTLTNPNAAAVLAFDAALYVLAILTLFDVYLITSPARAHKAAPLREADATLTGGPG
ncbi:MAG TPA: hypothetical protein VJQ08_07315 [Candidatus Dormibacteraeota bacterium]|nr:hypothetical protein [Candidatus Dormibacteraeota bacterium]